MSHDSHVEDSQRWINQVMARIIENLGLDVDKARYEISKSINFLVTTIYYVRLQFKNKENDQNEELSMVLKRPTKNFIHIGRIDFQFENEILFYQTYIQPNERHFYARCYYAEKRSPTDFVIALENVNERGYHSCSYPHNAPFEYTLAAMRELGRFHGKGYVMKELQREKFFDIVARLQEPRYAKGYVMEACFNVTATRSLEYLRRQGYDAAFCDRMEAILTNAFDEVMMKIIKPLEPLATMCHGDFLLNNILFKADEGGRYRAMLIDFALIRYSTPVVDLSTYFYNCCWNEEIREKFFDIMRAYHDALMEYLLDAGVQDIEKYSYNALLDDFRRGALFGFIVVSQFLPAILGYLKLEAIVQDTISLGALGYAKKHKYDGGDEVCKILADILLHLRDLGCLKHIL
ncbi:uncharacterized protein LOC112458440 [Temnothorax curvispinosus]|uniref:Uncharacterized protein LOC112458440 n=1 Tax=Temnothorax curvispinosus TaxID=300111 RepID=A0A6J1Q830_9HYME|nr:uncharacterized protein LOC112458440 [Temnothorax curvispinosus]